MESEEILVSVSCITYNHAPYIRQCLDGFMMQQTDFAFEVLIHDDASTDGTMEIIKEYEAKYPNIIKPIYEEENQWVKGRKGSAVFNFPRAKGKYIALCEGDDYWTDPLKLQKQVDILESDASIGAVYTAFEVVDTQNNKIECPHAAKHMKRSFSGDIFGDLLFDNFPQTLTLVFRKCLFECVNYLNNIDYSLFLYLSVQSKFIYVPDVMGRYRINPMGLMRTGMVSLVDFDQIRLHYLGLYFSNKNYKRKGRKHMLLCKYFLLHQCHITRLRDYKSLYDKIFCNNCFLRILFPFGLITTSIVRIKQRYEL